jgi:hypothetical protein
MWKDCGCTQYKQEENANRDRRSSGSKVPNKDAIELELPSLILSPNSLS